MTIEEEETTDDWKLLIDRLREIFHDPTNVKILLDALERVINNTRYGSVSIIIIDGRITLITEENKQKVI